MMLRKRSPSKYKELQYQPLNIHAEQASAKAIKILEAAEAHDFGWMPYLLQHSQILFFAGLRAQSPYVGFSPLMTATRINRLYHFLAEEGLDLISEGDFSAKAPASYSFFNRRLIMKLPEHYGFLQKAGTEWLMPRDMTQRGIIEWSYLIENQLAQRMEDGSLPRQWLYDWWAPHNLRFGMLLGYPGVAVSSMLWAESQVKHTGRDAKMAFVGIDQEEELFGPRAGFDTAKNTHNEPEIVQTHRLWNDVVAQVTDHFEQKGIAKNRLFLKEFHALKQSEGR